MLLAIDPGADSGWSLFLGSTCVACGLGDPRTSPRHRLSDITDVVIERPRIYPHDKPDPNDILTLAIRAGEWGGVYRSHANVRYVTPSEWKGSVPKAIHHARLVTKLSSDETALIQTVFRSGYRSLKVRKIMDRLEAPPVPLPMPKGKQHNVLDAVGIGLFAVGR